MEINFYQIDDLIHKSIAALLLKILENKQRVLIYDQDVQLLSRIDEGLWSFSKTKFLPHSCRWDKLDSSRQPILLTEQPKNDNDATSLLILRTPQDDFWKNFAKIYYFFDTSQTDEARKFWRYQHDVVHNLNFYKRIDGKWLKIDEIV